MFRKTVIILFVLSFLSSSVNAGVPWRDDPVYTKVLYVVAGVLSIAIGAGVGGVLGSMFTPPEPTICCARLADCKGSVPSKIDLVDESVCQEPIDCAKWINQYQAGCDAEKALLNRPTIVGVGIGAGLGVIGFTAFCLIRAFRTMSGERQPMLPKSGEIV